MKKKLLIVPLFAAVLFTLVACGSSGDASKDSKSEAISRSEDNITGDLTEGIFKQFTFSYPSTWTTKLSENGNNLYLYPTEDSTDGLLMVSYAEGQITDAKDSLDELMTGISKGDGVSNFSNTETTIQDGYAQKASYKQMINGLKYEMESYVWPVNTDGVLIVTCGVGSTGKVKHDDISSLLETLKRPNDTASDVNVDGSSISYYEISNDFQFSLIQTEKPNSAGGVDMCIQFYYSGEKEIKYIYFTVTPYNAVNDIVSSEIGGASTLQCELTGPVTRGELDEETGEYSKNWYPVKFENLWYNKTISYARIDKFMIEYMDGTTVTCTKDIPAPTIAK